MHLRRYDGGETTTRARVARAHGVQRPDSNSAENVTQRWFDDVWATSGLLIQGKTLNVGKPV
jgi:hypothetical protein